MKFVMYNKNIFFYYYYYYTYYYIHQSIIHFYFHFNVIFKKKNDSFNLIYNVTLYHFICTHAHIRIYNLQKYKTQKKNTYIHPYKKC